MPPVSKKQAQVTPADENRLERCSPAYRAAVLGARRVRGAVQFAAYCVSERHENGRTILRATIDEGQVVEIRMPKGLGVYLTQKGGRA